MNIQCHGAPLIVVSLTLFAISGSKHSLIILMLQDQEVDQDLELLVLASDGLWDVVANEVFLLMGHSSIIFNIGYPII